MMGYKKSLLIGMLCIGLLIAAPSLAVTPYDDVLVQQAMKNLEKENLEEALDDLTQAWQKGTHTAEKAFLLGVVYRKMLNYPKAQEYLEQAVSLKPNFPDARRLLADTLLALDKPDLAMPQLQELERIGYQPAQTAFLQGMAATKQKRYAEAVEYFRKAEQDPSLAQEAKLQISLALAAQNRLKEAKQNLDELVALAPQTQTAGFAQRYSNALERRIKELSPFHFYATLGLDWDSNVTVQPGNASAAQLVSGRGDMVYTYSGTFEYNFFPTKAYGLLAQYYVMQNFHPRLSTFDQWTNILGLVPMYQFTNSKLWFPFSFNYTDLQSDKYYTAFTLAPTYLYMVSPKTGLEVKLRAAKEYYWFDESLQNLQFPFPQDRRTDQSYGGSLGVYYFFKEQEGFLQGRLTYQHNFATGSNWDMSSYQMFLMAQYPFTKRFKMSTFLNLLLEPYDNKWFGTTSLFEVPAIHAKRRDTTLMYGVNATYDIYKGLEFKVQYYLIRDYSNISIYDYTRHIVGCQLGFRY
jgi:tetratricopeptide (TPR) repeat protein